jgi:hypothetical protein
VLLLLLLGFQGDDFYFKGAPFIAAITHPHPPPCPPVPPPYYPYAVCDWRRISKNKAIAKAKAQGA